MELIAFVQAAMTWFNAVNNDNEDCDFLNGETGVDAWGQAQELEQRAATLLSKLGVHP